LTLNIDMASVIASGAVEGYAYADAVWGEGVLAQRGGDGVGQKFS
jgi:hypothetical protein